MSFDLYEAYRRGGDIVRRLLNQFFFAKVLVGQDNVQVEFTEPVGALYSLAAVQFAADPKQEGAQYLRHCAPSLFSVTRWPSSNAAILAPSA
ncbi:MAG: hypothetical protein EXQ71_02225 [Acidimicrobiia bacterium]|nr:hypothetical protein [Acidimicrobiia bacterium]